MHGNIECLQSLKKGLNIKNTSVSIQYADAVKNINKMDICIMHINTDKSLKS